MIAVLFNDPEEWLEELKLNKPMDNIVRLTLLFQHSGSLPLRSVQVLGSYVYHPRGGAESTMFLCRLSVYCGEDMPGDPKATTRARTLLESLKKTASGERGYVVAGGEYRAEGV